MSIEDYGFLIGFICMMVGLGCLIIAVVLTKNIKYKKENLKEMEEYIDERTQTLLELEDKINKEKESIRKARKRFTKKQEDDE